MAFKFLSSSFCTIRFLQIRLMLTFVPAGYLPLFLERKQSQQKKGVDFPTFEPNYKLKTWLDNWIHYVLLFYLLVLNDKSDLLKEVH